MSISLEKGQSISLEKCIDLTKRPTGLSKIVVGLGWDVNAGIGADYDLDAVGAYLQSDGTMKNSSDFCYFGHKRCTGMYLTGDNLTGEGDGDDEQIIVDLNAVPSHVSAIEFSCIIYQARAKGQRFGRVKNSYIRVVDEVTDTEICKYNLNQQFSNETGVIVGRLVRNNGAWDFIAIGDGYNDITCDSLKNQYLNGKRGIPTQTQTISSPTGTSMETSNNHQKKGFLGRLFGR